MALPDIESEPKLVTAAELREGWRKYIWLFGEPPHGTQRQLAAMLVMSPAHEPEPTDESELAKAQAKVKTLREALAGVPCSCGRRHGDPEFEEPCARCSALDATKEVHDAR